MTQFDANADRERFLALIRRWHAGHPRADQVQHCINVGQWLERALDLEPAMAAAERRDLILAALGHDLYEDSAIRPRDLAAEFGAHVDRLIRGMTEEEDGVAAYVERVESGPEEVRLIKLCDGIDNYGGLVENGLVQEDPQRWLAVAREQMEPMFGRLANIPFRHYLAAGAFLAEEVARRRERFWAVVAEGDLGRS